MKVIQVVNSFAASRHAGHHKLRVDRNADGGINIDCFKFAPILIVNDINKTNQHSIYAGTLRRNSSSQIVASESLGARQSPRGESEPPEPTLGPLGSADRLN